MEKNSLGRDRAKVKLAERARGSTQEDVFAAAVGRATDLGPNVGGAL